MTNEECTRFYAWLVLGEGLPNGELDLALSMPSMGRRLWEMVKHYRAEHQRLLEACVDGHPAIVNALPESHRPAPPEVKP